MTLKICEHNANDRPVIWNLFQFYCYDTSAEDQCDVDANGLYSLSADYFAQYWTRPGWQAHLLRWNDSIAGFALVETSEAVAGAMELADLFVLNRFRRRGIGQQVARHFMSTRQVPWTVVIFDEALDAQAFWSALFKDPRVAPSRQVPDPDGRNVKTYVLEPTIAA